MNFTKIANKILDTLLINKGKRSSQIFYENLLRQSFAGLNIGRGGDLRESGELNALKYIFNKFSPVNNREITIFDVGANLGEYTKAISEIFTKMNYNIYCFEPSPSIFPKLQKNLINTPPRLLLNNIGLGDEPKRSILYSDQERSGLSSLYDRKLDHFNVKLDKKEEVMIETIDLFCKTNNIAKIDFLKIDVEGNELNVLKGAKEMLKNRAIKNIQFEFGGCNIDSKTYFQDFYYLLTKNNFKISRILQDGLFEIKKYQEYNEIFLTTNYLAELKED